MRRFRPESCSGNPNPGQPLGIRDDATPIKYARILSVGLVATVAFAWSTAAAVENTRERAGYCQSLERGAKGAGAAHLHPTHAGGEAGLSEPVFDPPATRMATPRQAANGGPFLPPSFPGKPLGKPWGSQSGWIGGFYDAFLSYRIAAALQSVVQKLGKPGSRVPQTRTRRSPITTPR